MREGISDRERFDRWQNAALDAWEKAGRVGIVEAVTGSGKTHVALKAIERLVKQVTKPVYPLIVVPTIPLMEQWKKALEPILDGDQVGMQGDSHKDTFATFISNRPVRAIVSTIHSAVTAIRDGLFDHCQKGGGHSFLIADECHHVLSRTATLYPQAIQYPFDFRLGISATVERCSLEGLGKVIYEYNLKTAVNEGVIPPFDIVNVAVELGTEETCEYLRLEDEIGKLVAQVKSIHNLKWYSGHALWYEIQMIARYDECPVARKLFGAIFRKAELVYTASLKMELAPRLIRALVGDGRKVLTFFERIRSAEMIEGETSPRKMANATADVLREGEPVKTFIYHSGLSKDRRKQVLAEFRTSGPSTLLACRALNEGLDVPTVDAALIVAATQNRRSMIQRIGRTLRQGDGKRRPLVIILHAKGTNDDRVRIDPHDKYFAGPARIFETDANGAVECVLALSKTGEPLNQWSLVIDRTKDWKENIIPRLGDLVEGATIRVEFIRGQKVEGQLEWIMRKGQFGLAGKKYTVDEIERVYQIV